MSNKQKSAEYLWGYDCGRFGANENNSHYTIFSTPEKTKEWEKGKADGRNDLIEEVVFKPTKDKEKDNG